MRFVSFHSNSCKKFQKNVSKNFIPPFSGALHSRRPEPHDDAESRRRDSRYITDAKERILTTQVSYESSFISELLYI